MKKCSKCKNIFELDNFYSDASKSSKKSGICKKCANKKCGLYYRTITGRFKTLIRVAKTKNYEVKLTFDEYKHIISQPCHYCDMVLNNDSTTYFLDRKDNEKIYSKETVLPCCETCNFMKKEMTYTKFLEHLVKISKKLRRDGF